MRGTDVVRGPESCPGGGVGGDRDESGAAGTVGISTCLVHGRAIGADSEGVGALVPCPIVPSDPAGIARRRRSRRGEEDDRPEYGGERGDEACGSFGRNEDPRRRRLMTAS